MNQLSNVVDLARYRQAGNGVRRGAATRLGARPQCALCRWQRDDVTGRPVCAWSAQGRARSATSFAILSGALKDKQERRPEAARRIRFQRFDGRSQQNPIRNLRTPRPRVGNRYAQRADGSPPAPVRQGGKS